MREKGNEYVILVEKPEGNRSLGRRNHSRVYGIKMDLREIAWGDMD
jgi:hypothetical protein